jgi:hypothetical protein
LVARLQPGGREPAVISWDKAIDSSECAVPSLLVGDLLREIPNMTVDATEWDRVTTKLARKRTSPHKN